MTCTLRFLSPALVRPALLWLVLLVSGCSGIGELGGSDSSPRLSPSEQTAVRGQVSAAMAAKRWKVAWNQEIEAGAEQAHLQEIALAALADRSRHAGDMLTALRERFGTLPAGGRTQVEELVAQARTAGRWAWALELELLSADDPPTFSRAWALYRAAPVDRAPGLLEAIQEARAGP